MILVVVTQGYVYIMANRRPTLYVGVTSELEQRVMQHKTGLLKDSFTDRYQLHNLVYYESFESIEEAIIREKQIKNMSRLEKLQMITRLNPTLKDLYSEIIG